MMAGIKSRTAQEDWEELKKGGVSNVVLDTLMTMIGLEEVKREFLRVRALVAVHKLQGKVLDDLR